MKASDVIKELQKMPPDAEVWHIWDGVARTKIEFVWLCSDGKIATSDYNMSVAHDQDRPDWAPKRNDNYYWYTPEDQNEVIDDEL